MALVSVDSFDLLSQNKLRVDSLERLLPGTKDTTRYSVLVKLHFEFRPEFQKALDYALLAYNQAEAPGDSVKIVESGRLVAYSLDDLGRNDEVIEILNRVLPIARRNVARYPELKKKLNLY